MSLKKTTDIEAPHAVYINERAGFEWRVLKVYSTSKKGLADRYARWFVAARSPMTFGTWEYGDSYISEIVRYGKLRDATPEFREHLDMIRDARRVAA